MSYHATRVISQEFGIAIASPHDLDEAIEDVLLVLAKKLDISQKEVIRQSLAQFIDKEKPFGESAINKQLQDYLYKDEDFKRA